MKISEILIMQFFYIIWPGLTFACVTNIAINNGKKAGIFFAAGDALGGGVLKILGLFGLGIVLKSHHLIYSGLKIIGVLYLLYLSSKIVIDTFKNQFESKSNAIESSYFKKGFLFSTSYIASILFYMTLFASMEENITYFEKFLMIIWMVSLNFIYHFSVIHLLTNNRIYKKIQKYIFAIRIVSCIFIAYFAIKVLLQLVYDLFLV
ncbi:LysE family translocator [Candidatus Deianiraea vastatrix]|uniref:Aminoacid transport protein n=1 Tax=Candidatus Deianiraea vastatrix TaxID=2163644 RepID=A0A5B8XH28_9RICK|nr:LysE family transporter [Candidatus Deianiraea vastatrix]QED23494.1 Putative aminoacid transport protein [Candidatus Deianiraea vastatrix]